ncbi:MULTISPECIES: hypothetical protein [Amycolatopsis]|uniref:Uncharacterized protein n=1 Tax=Amycolatopsis japonica TaxID=208439 RepID=A0A075UNZ1_9PSEU|nr:MULTISPECIES: hypothetical protein [Amycolatopsis]AIG74618.1 Hypothetical protein AJAP_08590 [Amycolatopsis japonica]OKJ91904.1 hypothetical protein AMK34_33375 [Amycolatopsis sp. CB00013]
MSGRVDAWIPALRTFANNLHQQVNAIPAPTIDREPGAGCTLMQECEALAAADKFVTGELKAFMTAAAEGFQTFEDLARRCANEYQSAGEAAATAIQGLSDKVNRGPQPPSAPAPDIPLLGNPYAPSL